MNQAQAISLFRTAVQIGGSYAVGRGLISVEDLQALLHNGELLVTAGLVVVTTLWGLWERRSKPDAQLSLPFDTK